MPKKAWYKIIENLTVRIERNPRDAVALFLRGIIYRQKGELAEAKADFNKAVELDSDFTDAYDSLDKKRRIDVAEYEKKHDDRIRKEEECRKKMDKQRSRMSITGWACLGAVVSLLPFYNELGVELMEWIVTALVGILPFIVLAQVLNFRSLDNEKNKHLDAAQEILSMLHEVNVEMQRESLRDDTSFKHEMHSAERENKTTKDDKSDSQLLDRTLKGVDYISKIMKIINWPK